MKIAIFSREVDDSQFDIILSILKAFRESGVELIFYERFYQSLTKIKDLDKIIKRSVFRSAKDIEKSVSIFLTLGGDGTFLESLTFVRDSGIPIAGINFGRLGFLTTSDLKSFKEWIHNLIEGNFKIEKRSILSIEAPFLKKTIYPYALNEVAIQRQDPNMLSIKVEINGEEIPTYWADGIVLATPTGSTAYSLSIGGPIVLPNSNVLILTPIAPHNLNVRPLVMSDDSVIKLTPYSRRGRAIFSMDNRSVEITDDDIIIIKKAGFELNYITFKSNSFIDALRVKLLWGEDKRNNY